MENRYEKMTEQELSDEAAHYRAIAERHERAFKGTRNTFNTTGLIILAILVIVIGIGIAWFVYNNRVKGISGIISAKGQADFSLATVGKMEQGAYDDIFGLSKDLTIEEIGGEEYYIASANGSFRVDSDKNLNNYLVNADLRPGNRGTFDLYVICRTDKREMVLQPIFSAWYETDNSEIKDAFSDKERKIAAEFLKGHILLFANMDEKGMYSGNIDYTKEITLNLSEGKAFQGNTIGKFSWGELIYEDSDKAVYRLPVYWVWPEQFGNFIYTGNSYNKNLFASTEAEDYKYFIKIMQLKDDYKKFFYIEEGTVNLPDISKITSTETDYKEATEIYECYSGWYNAADEKIGELISYIELGFEISEEN